MAFSETELKFIDANSALIEGGKAEYSKLQEAYKTIFSYRTSKLSILLPYLVFGIKAFEVTGYATKPNAQIEDILVNTTGLGYLKAKGQPLVPSLFSAKAKIIYWKISNGTIEAKKPSQLVDRKTLNEEMIQGGYNLVSLDTKKANDTITNVFGGKVLSYFIKVTTAQDKRMGNSYSFEFRTESEKKDDAVALFTTKLKENITGYYGSDMAKFAEEVAGPIASSIKWDKSA